MNEKIFQMTLNTKQLYHIYTLSKGGNSLDGVYDIVKNIRDEETALAGLSAEAEKQEEVLLKMMYDEMELKYAKETNIVLMLS